MSLPPTSTATIASFRVERALLNILSTRLAVPSLPSGCRTTGPITPDALLAICAVLSGSQPTVAHPYTYDVLPAILNCLRPWRLLPSSIQYSPTALADLALALEVEFESAQCSANPEERWLQQRSVSAPGRPPRLAIRWIRARTPTLDLLECNDSSDDCCHDDGLSSPYTLNASPGVLLPESPNAHVATAISITGTASQDDVECKDVRHHEYVHFRSGCCACRRPRVPTPGLPAPLPVPVPVSSGPKLKPSPMTATATTDAPAVMRSSAPRIASTSSMNIHSTSSRSKAVSAPMVTIASKTKATLKAGTTKKTAQPTSRSHPKPASATTPTPLASSSTFNATRNPSVPPSTSALSMRLRPRPAPAPALAPVPPLGQKGVSHTRSRVKGPSASARVAPIVIPQTAPPSGRVLRSTRNRLALT